MKHPPRLAKPAQLVDDVAVLGPNGARSRNEREAAPLPEGGVSTQQRLARSDDAREGVLSFQEKRAARFSGR